MRKFLISIISIFIGFSVFAAGENIPTSKSYVDSALVPKQDIIEGTNDAPRVLTNTGTAGEYGTKDIYDSTDTYSGQMDALIDAQTMNTAVQNAIDSEFQCVEYNPNDPTDCWLMDIRGATENISPNLLNMDKIISTSTSLQVNRLSNGFELTNTNSNSNASLCIEIGKIDDFVGKTLTRSSNSNCLYVYFYQTNKNGTQVGYTRVQTWSNITKIATTAITLDICIGVRPSSTCQVTNIQVEEGATATPYQPYGNIYVPATTPAEP